MNQDQQRIMMKAWWTDSLVKVFRDASPDSEAGEGFVAAARNEVVSLQFVLLSDRPRRGVTIDVQPLSCKGAELEPPRWRAVGYVSVYPGRDGVLDSIRSEQMLEGIQDYELLKALEEKKPESAQAIAAEAIPSFTDYGREPGGFRRLRERLLVELSG